MKFTPEVVAALKTLRDNATNDFERHRIDVLERDLTAPPTVEVIDVKHQKFNGVIFSDDGKQHLRGSIRIHQAIWNYCVGEIPSGYVIHHKDINPLNNTLENLQLMENSAHTQFHASLRLVPLTCEQCGKKFLGRFTKRKHSFCSPVCQIAWRRAKGIGFEKRICIYCGKEYSTRKDSPQKFCSSACSARSKANARETRFCLICGKAFTVSIASSQKTCSNSCGSLMRESRRKN